MHRQSYVTLALLVLSGCAMRNSSLESAPTRSQRPTIDPAAEAAAEERERQRRSPFEAESEVAAKGTCSERKRRGEIAFLAKADEGSYRCVFETADDDAPIFRRCSEDQSADACRQDTLASCYKTRNGLAGQFYQMSATRFPTSRDPSASVHEVSHPDSGATLGHYVTADCGLEDDDEYEARKQMPRGANCNDYPACRYKNEYKRDAAIFDAIEARKRAQAARPEPAKNRRPETKPSSASTSKESKKELADGLYVSASECVDSPDSGACASISTVCIDRSGGRVVAKIARRSPVLVRNKVEAGIKLLDIGQSSLEGRLKLILPFENTSCSSAALQDQPATGQVSSDGKTLTLSYVELKRDAKTCSLVTGEPSKRSYYKATTGDEQCRSLPMGPLSPAPISTPMLRGGGVN